MNFAVAALVALLGGFVAISIRVVDGYRRTITPGGSIINLSSKHVQDRGRSAEAAPPGRSGLDDIDAVEEAVPLAPTVEYHPHGVVVIRHALSIPTQKRMASMAMNDEHRYLEYLRPDADPYAKVLPNEQRYSSPSGPTAVNVLQQDYYTIPEQSSLSALRGTGALLDVGNTIFRERISRINISRWRSTAAQVTPFPWSTPLKSLLVLAYEKNSTVDWHYDMADSPGWVLAASVGAGGRLEYAHVDDRNTRAPPRELVHSIDLQAADIVAFDGNALLHRVVDIQDAPDAWLLNKLKMRARAPESRITRFPLGTLRLSFQMRFWSCEGYIARFCPDHVLPGASCLSGQASFCHWNNTVQQYKSFVYRFPVTWTYGDLDGKAATLVNRIFGEPKPWETETPPLLARFDWRLFPKQWSLFPYETGIPEERRFQDINTVVADPELLPQLIATAERDFDVNRSGRVVVFCCSEIPLSLAFGRDADERVQTVKRLQQFFGRIMYQPKDIELDGVESMPYGLAEYYWRGEVQRYADAAVAAASLREGAKPKRVLAAWGKYFDFGWYDPASCPDSENKVRCALIAAAKESRYSAHKWTQTDAARDAGVVRLLLDPRDFWGTAAGFQFLMAPIGSGIVSPKIVEALMLLTIPIVQRGTFPMADDYVRLGFPIVVVDRWEEITTDNLDVWQVKLTPRLEEFRSNCLTTNGFWNLFTGKTKVCGQSLQTSKGGDFPAQTCVMTRSREMHNSKNNFPRYSIGSTPLQLKPSVGRELHAEDSPAVIGEVAQLQPAADASDNMTAAGLHTSVQSTHVSKPLFDKGKIVAATVFTGHGSEVRLPGPAGWDWTVANAGEGKEWKGFITNVEAMQEWVQKFDDEQIVLHMDGKDVMYAGCSMDYLAEQFRALTEATGAPVIFGAEHNCWKPPSVGCDKYPVRNRDKVLEKFNLTAAKTDAYSNDPKQDRNLTGAGVPWPDGKHGELKYLNAGFYMGRVKHLRALYTEWLKFAPQEPYFNDQRWAHELLADRPDLLGLDYAGALVINLYGVQLKIFSHQDKTWMNKITHKPVCFFHANGDSALPSY